METENFDYVGTLKKLEEIASKVEDPGTGIDDIGKYVREADIMIEKCRQYLREVREKTEKLG